MTSANSNVVEATVQNTSSSFTIQSGQNTFDEQGGNGFGLGSAFINVTVPNEGVPPLGQGFGVALAQDMPFGLLGIFNFRFTGFSDSTLALALSSAFGPPPQNAFTTLSYTDRFGNLITLQSANATYSVGTNDYVAWVWDLGAVSSVGSMLPGNDYTVTLT